MSAGSASPHGFAVVRGRGYRPGQVDRFVMGVSRDRDEAWERAARLAVLAKGKEAEAERLREVVARLRPQSYESLGKGPRQLFALTQEEAVAVRAGAQEEARCIKESAERVARETCGAARAYVDALRAEADEYARRRVLASRATADEVGTAARAEVKEAQQEALATLREMRQRAAGLLAGQESEHAERWEAAERQHAERHAGLAARHAELAEQAEARLKAAQQALAQAEEMAQHSQETAAACGADLLAKARLRRERIGHEAARALREQDVRRREVLAHLDRLCSGLVGLTARLAPPEETP